MPELLPPEIRVEQRAPDDVRYFLPRRRLVHSRWLAALLLLIPLLAVFFVFWLAGVSGIYAVIELILVLSGVFVPLAALIWGHSTVQVRRGRLRIGECLGPFGRTRGRQLADIRRLEVAATDTAGRFAEIRVKMARGKSATAAVGYPRDWVVPLAHELARQIETMRANSFDRLDQSERKVEVIENAGPAIKVVTE